MCYGCWEERGRDQIDNEKVRAIQPLIADVYAYSCVGGNLHIVLDDDNLEDDHIRFCDERIANGGHPEDPNHSPTYTKAKLDNPDSPEQLAAERACCDALKAMTYEERSSALALYDGFWT